MKRSKIIVSMLLIIGGITPFISFGQTQTTQQCLTCGSSPANLVLLNNFTTEILATINTVGTKSPYAGKLVSPTRFESGKFIAPKQSIMTKSLRRAKEEVASILAFKRISLEWRDLADLGDTVLVLSRNKSILRDRQKVSKVEQIINKKKYELSVGGGWSDKIGGITLAKINSIIKRYKTLGVLDGETKLSQGAEYGDLVMTLGRLNSSLKQLVSIGGTDAENDNDIPSFKTWISGKVQIRIDGDTLDQIKSDYNCTRRYACEDSRNSLKDGFKEIAKSFGKGLGDSRDQIKLSTKKLTTAYSAENLKKTFVTENTIVNQFSGSINSIKKRRDRQKDERQKKNRDKVIKNIVEDMQSSQDAQAQLEDDLLGIEPTSPITINSANQEDIINRFKNRLQKTKDTITSEHDLMIQKYYTTKTPDVTAYFVAISQQINQVVNIIGSKDKENCLIKNLGSLCEKQCSNIGNKKCYY